MAKQLISTGTAAPTSTPTFEGQIFVDTTNDDVYMAKGVASSADWVQVDATAGAGNSFETITCDAGTSPVADSATDTLTLTSTDGSVVITGTAASDTVDLEVASAWTTATLTINDGGTLTYSTTYNRYIIIGKMLYWNFSMKQTNAGSGTTDITIDPPGGVTLVDGHFGPCTTFDMSNSNQMEGTAVEVVSNKLKVYNPALLIYLRGGAFVGNNGVCGLTCSLVLEIS